MLITLVEQGHGTLREFQLAKGRTLFCNFQQQNFIKKIWNSHKRIDCYRRQIAKIPVRRPVLAVIRPFEAVVIFFDR